MPVAPTLIARRLEIGETVSCQGTTIGVIVGLDNGDPVLNIGGRVAKLARETFDADLIASFEQVSIGDKVDSRYIRLFKRINRGEVTAVHSDGMVVVRWDREGECLHHCSELQKTASLWDHLKNE